jgi:hypothetical protein
MMVMMMCAFVRKKHIHRLKQLGLMSTHAHIRACLRPYSSAKEKEDVSYK